MHDATENFRTLISPWIAGYTHISVSAMGTREENQNVLLKARIVLAAGLNPAHSMTPLNDTLLWAAAEVAPFSPQKLDELLIAFEAGKLSVGNVQAAIPAEMSSSFHPTYHSGYYRPIGSNQNAVRIPALVVSGGSRYTALNKPFKANELDWYIPNLDPPFVDLADLHTYYGLADASGDQLLMEIMVRPPIEMADRSVIENGKAYIRILAAKGTDFAAVTVGYRTVGGTSKQLRGRVSSTNISWKDNGQIVEGECTVDVNDAPTLQCFLSYAGTSIQQWWIVDPKRLLNPRHAIHSAYDANHSVLNRLLFEGRKSDSREFEDGVAMVLGMLGFSITQHGRSQKLSDAPDIIAITPFGHVAVVECTVGLPDQDDQVAKVLQRAEALRRSLTASGWPGVQVLPVVVTSLTESDIRMHKTVAEKQGVAVVCLEDIQRALTTVRFPADADRIFRQATERLKTNALQI